MTRGSEMKVCRYEIQLLIMRRLLSTAINSIS